MASIIHLSSRVVLNMLTKLRIFKFINKIDHPLFIFKLIYIKKMLLTLYKRYDLKYTL